jgi:signal transduction histidine kinase
MSTRLLLVAEESGTSSGLLGRLLSRSPRRFVLERASSLQEARSVLHDRPIDLVLFDLNEAAGHKSDLAIEALVAASAGRPVVVLSDSGDEKTMGRAVRAGAHDVLVKGQMDSDSLSRTIRVALEEPKGPPADPDPDPDPDPARQEALHASKLASVGQLAAGIAHEINTPIQYVGDNLRFMAEGIDSLTRVIRACEALVAAPGPASTAALAACMAEADVDYLLENMPAAIAQSIEGIGHVAEIVLAMKEFSHPGEREKAPVDINRSIRNTLAVSRNEWKHVAQVETSFDNGLPKILCFGGEINQVLLNLVVNAAQAIESAKSGGFGRIAITTRRQDANVEIIIADNGPGMSEEVRAHIFDPFFTTKPVGQGSGQGLAICHDVVVAKHGGLIAVDSEIGRGTRFTLTLPIDGTVVAPELPS